MRYHVSVGVIRTFAQTYKKQLVVLFAGLLLATLAAMTLSANAAVSVINGCSIDDDSAGTWTLQGDCTLTAKIDIPAGTTFEGNGHTMNASFVGPGSGNSNNAALRAVDADGVTINNVIIDGSSGTSIHGILIYGSENIDISNVTTINMPRSGVNINGLSGGSSVTIENITTSGSGWHAINVDQGTATLTVNGTSSHFNELHIYSDHYLSSSTITINDTNSQYVVIDNPPDNNNYTDDRAYMLKERLEITAPAENEVVAGSSVALTAEYNDHDSVNEDNVQWAVREGTCAANTNTVFGNVDGFSNSYTWDGASFSATLDTLQLNDGMHCFVINPVDDLFGTRETREFIVDNTDPGQVLGLSILGGHSASSPEIGCNGYTDSPQIRIVWDASTDPNIDYYWFGTKFNEKHRQVSAGTEFYNANMTPGNNPYYYTVIAVDKAGNESEISEQCELILDMEPPIVDITSPADSAVLSGAVDIEGSVTDDVELLHYNLSLYPSTTDLSDGGTHTGDRLNDVNWCTTPISGTVATSVDVVGLLCEDWDTTAYPDGDYQIRLAARDASGLRDTSDPFTGGTTSVHVIAVTIDNAEEGATLGASTTRDNDSDDDQGSVLGVSTTNDGLGGGSVLGDSDTLSETGSSAVSAPVIGLAIIAATAFLLAKTRSTKISLHR